MENNLSEIDEYIYKNFTPQDQARAIDYYRSMTGTDLETARREVERIYTQRSMDGRVLPMPKAWTPAGQEKEKGERMLFAGRLMLVLTIVIVVGFSILICHQIQKTVNEVSAKDREEWLDNGFQSFRTQGGAFEIVDNYYNPSHETWKDLYLFRPEQEGDIYLGVLSHEWWYHYDEYYAKGLEFFYVDSGVREKVETDDGAVYEVAIVHAEDVMAGYGIGSDNALVMQAIVIACFGLFGMLMGVGAVLLIVFGKKKIK